MIEKNYEEYRRQTLEQYANYTKLLGELPPKEKTDRDIDQDALERIAEHIRQNKFTLMVIGNAKSGKSVFINAYLKADILPVDVKSTCAPVEVSYSADESRLTYWTGDGNKSEMTGEEAIRDFLKDNASISNKYRDIPAAYLDNLLVARKGEIKPDEIDDVIRHLVKKDPGMRRCQSAVRQYLKEGKNLWRKIVTRIEIRYPFAPEMKDVRVIEVPGINSTGFPGKATEESLRDADAIVFIRKLHDRDDQSKSFHDFQETYLAGQNGKPLFVFLSGASELSGEEDKIQLVYDARRIFKSGVGEDKIIPIDSIIQKYINRCEGEKETSIDEIVRNEVHEKTISPVIRSAWAEKNGVNEFFADMKALSGFQEVGELFEKYAKSAQRDGLIRFLDYICTACDGIIACIDQRIEMKRKQITMTSDEWQKEIRQRQHNLEKLEKQIDIDLNEEARHYLSGDIAIKTIRERVQQVKDAVKKEIEKGIDDSLPKRTENTVEPLCKVPQELCSDMIRDCNARLKAKCDLEEFISKIPPSLRTIDHFILDSIAQEWPMKEDYIDRFYHIWGPRVIDKMECVERAMSLIDEWALRVEELTMDLMDSIFHTYRSRLLTLVASEKERYTEALTEKATTQDLEQDIHALELARANTESRKSNTNHLALELKNIAWLSQTNPEMTRS